MPCSLEFETDYLQLYTEESKLKRSVIIMLQVLALVYISSILILHIYLSSSMLVHFLSGSLSEKTELFYYPLALVLAPLAWICYIFFTCISLSIFGRSFLQPNYALTPEISIWSVDFVKCWAFYKSQDVAAKALAVHLKGTKFLKNWFEMQGVHIGSSVLIDSIDITDPSLVSIGDQVVIAEGALIQSHEVRNGMVIFHHIKIGQNSSVGPYAMIQKVSIVGEDAEVLSLQKTEEGKLVLRSEKGFKLQNGHHKSLLSETRFLPFHHFMGIYAIGFLSSIYAAIAYLLYIYLSAKSPSLCHFTFVCTAGAYHWLPAAITSYAVIISEIPTNTTAFAFLVANAYVSHGLILTIITSILNHLLARKAGSEQPHLATWFRHHINVACHLRFAKLLSGTEAFCTYLRLLGANVGQHCSIRAINAITDPRLISIGDGVHLGDFSRIVSGVYSSDGFSFEEIYVQRNSILGSQSLILPGSTIQEDVILGALSITPMNSILLRGGVFVGSHAPIMVKNKLHASDERIEEMDDKYKKLVRNLDRNMAITTMKLNSRYFHRIGVGGKGILKMYSYLIPDNEMLVYVG